MGDVPLKMTVGGKGGKVKGQALSSSAAGDSLCHWQCPAIEPSLRVGVWVQFDVRCFDSQPLWFGEAS